jgi:hypothetical protein
LDRVDILIRNDGKIFISPIRELGMQTTVFPSAPAIDTNSTFNDKVDHHPLANFKMLNVFAHLNNSSRGFVPHYPWQSHVLLAEVDSNIPGTNATIGHLN